MNNFWMVVDYRLEAVPIQVFLIYTIVQLLNRSRSIDKFFCSFIVDLIFEFELGHLFTY